MPSPYEKHFVNSQSVTDQAFHGTSRQNADAILSDNFKPSDGENQFLGPGVYFFERQPSEAERWAKNEHPKGWAVLRSVVRYGRCLNLDEQRHSDILTLIVSELRKRRNQAITESDAVKILAQHVQIDTVIGVHRKNSTIIPWHGARFGMGNKLMLCVRTLANIQDTQPHCTGP
jgi:hypothetical protein